MCVIARGFFLALCSFLAVSPAAADQRSDSQITSLLIELDMANGLRHAHRK